MYAVLGEIEFDVVAYWDEFESTMGVDYTSHARIEGKPGVQFIGDKLDKITLKFNFHSQYCQPTTELNSSAGSDDRAPCDGAGVRQRRLSRLVRDYRSDRYPPTHRSLR